MKNKKIFLKKLNQFYLKNINKIKMMNILVCLLKKLASKKPSWLEVLLEH